MQKHELVFRGLDLSLIILLSVPPNFCLLSTKKKNPLRSGLWGLEEDWVTGWPGGGGGGGEGGGGGGPHSSHTHCVFDGSITVGSIY